MELAHMFISIETLCHACVMLTYVCSKYARLVPNYERGPINLVTLLCTTLKPQL